MMQPTNPWIFWPDYRATSGGGHVMRCVALAQELQKYSPVVFVKDCGSGAWSDLLSQKKFTKIGKDAISRRNWQGSFVDGYEFDDVELKRLAQLAPPLVVIDDLLRLPSAASLFICPGVEPKTRLSPNVHALLGAKYALLGPEYRARPSRIAKPTVQNILISFGMRDSQNGTYETLLGLEKSAQKGFIPKITVAIGAKAPHKDAIIELITESNLTVNMLVDTKDMMAEIDKADMVVGAGGVGLFERLACGTPSITISSAENQSRQIQQAENVKATIYAGGVDNLNSERLSGLIRSISRNLSLRQEMSKAGQKLVDGQGVKRVAAAMTNLSRRRLT